MDNIRSDLDDGRYEIDTSPRSAARFENSDRLELRKMFLVQLFARFVIFRAELKKYELAAERKKRAQSPIKNLQGDTQWT